MDLINITVGLLLVALGIFLIVFYKKLKSENKTGGLSFKLQTAGIGALIIGISLIIREFWK
ncbi:hypothetical protein [Aequorivita sinensis]|uniref:hypothetical protein n=1 Tax=Aequorivita sinensis TaxID=1382458 RepID=UPI0023003BE0|nr:hypothetical protein [Aequorivita sinensis]